MGVTLQALLPLVNTTARERVSEYDGFATIFDTKFACMKPTFSSAWVEFQDDTYITRHVEADLPEHMSIHSEYAPYYAGKRHETPPLALLVCNRHAGAFERTAGQR